VVLIDSGSSHTFLNSCISTKLKLTQAPIRSMSIKVANGDTLACHSEVQKITWWCQGQTFRVDAKVIEMGAYDLILGMDWLEMYKPMVCD
jgi:predicted aspartyl protease